MASFVTLSTSALSTVVTSLAASPPTGVGFPGRQSQLGAAGAQPDGEPHQRETMLYEARVTVHWSLNKWKCLPYRF